jgi:hypothetical protein
MKNLQALLDEFERKGQHMDSFEANHLNALLMSKGLAPIAGRANQVSIAPVPFFPTASRGLKAQFDIRVMRNSANIADDLEAIIFGMTFFQSGYLGIINPPTGGTVTVAGGTNVSLPDRIRFTYVVGLNTDTIDVMCNQLPYPGFLSAMSNANFLLSNIRYSLDNAAQTGQFSMPFEFRQKSLFGKGDQNPITVIAFKKPEQFQAGIIDLPVEAPISREDAIALKVAAITTDPFTLSCFVEHFDKQDRSNVPGTPTNPIK